MRTSNMPSGGLRTSEVSLNWVELKSGAGGLTSFEIPKQSCIRVRSAVAGLTVTIDGILAMTMDSGEIALFNVGAGSPDDQKVTVTVVVSGACFIQHGRETDRRPV